MKIHEETWTRVLWMHDHNQEPIYGIESDAIPKKVDDHFCEFSAGEHARSQLAAAAPEMARLLLEFYDRACPSINCNGPFDDGTHDATCEVRIVLVKAGVLPSGDT
jgi:hypothetical protein